MKKLSEHAKTLMFAGARELRQGGEELYYYIEQNLYKEETKDVLGFLVFTEQNSVLWGMKNIDEIYSQYKNRVR